MGTWNTGIMPQYLSRGASGSPKTQKKSLCTSMFNAALFKIARSRNPMEQECE